MGCEVESLRGYVSHCIRGKKGDSCTESEMIANCAKAVTDVSQLGLYLQRAMLPVELYIPGANDEFVQHAYKDKLLTEEQILGIDCKIIQARDFLLVYDWMNYISNGMNTEIEFAKEHDIPIITIQHVDPVTWIGLLHELTALLQNKLTKPNIIKIGG